MTDKKHRRAVPDRARRRAIRAHALRTGLSYSVAARQLDAYPFGALDGDSGAREAPASLGRTVYPTGTDEHRQWLIAMRAQRPYDLRLRDTRQAALLPLGRASHLAQRFPSTRGEPGTLVGPLYAGASRTALLAMLYVAAAYERPQLLPSAGELAWMAELGEETAVDIGCAAVDRAARGLLDRDRWSLWSRIEAALTAATLAAAEPAPEADDARLARSDARSLQVELRDLSLRSSVDGARHTLDALLVSSEDGHAPGTRVRILARPQRGRTATIVGARWSVAGAPIAYEVCPDAVPTPMLVAPDDLTLLEGSARPSPIAT